MKAHLIALALLVLSATPVFAVQFRQVLVDPVVTDSGGEAVELYNDGNETVSIGDWWLASQSSAQDATVPSGMILAPGATYLIADTGWSEKRDEPYWRDADHEEALTLANTNGSLALYAADGTLIDSLSWTKVAAGKALLRSGNEFVEAEPDFFGTDAISIPAIIEPPLALTVFDDDNASLAGIQITPYPGATRNLTLAITATGPVALLFLNQSITAEPGNATIGVPYTTPPGTYVLEAVKDTYHAKVNITVLARQAVSFSGNLLFKATAGAESDPQTLIVRNTGNVPATVGIAALPFTGPQTLDGILAYNGAALSRNLTTIVGLMPGEAHGVPLVLAPPANAEPGSYTGRIIVRPV